MIRIIRLSTETSAFRQRLVHLKHFSIDQFTQGVCLCATNGEKVLAVSRRGTSDQFGLPGGKVEPGENLLDALVREVFEETRITIDPNLCTEIYYRVDDEFFVTTYLYHGIIDQPPVQGDAGAVGWVSWEDLFNGPFGQYNRRLKDKLNLSHWSIEKAVEFLNTIRGPIHNAGFDLGITGSVLFSGTSNNDLDIIIYPLDASKYNLQDLYSVLNGLNMHQEKSYKDILDTWYKKGSFDIKHVEKWSYDGKHIDLFFLR